MILMRFFVSNWKLLYRDIITMLLYSYKRRESLTVPDFKRIRWKAIIEIKWGMTDQRRS